MTAAPEAGAQPDTAEAKKRRAYATVLVSVPGWPSQDPGRLMLYSVRSTPMKAARMIKRLKKQMPEFEWSKEMLTDTEARAVRLKPFRLAGPWATPVEVRFNQRGSKVVPVAPES